MIIIGAKGHAKEILSVVRGMEEDFCFFDNVSADAGELLFGCYRILKTEEQVRERFRTDNRFVLGTGDPESRFKLASLFKSWGGVLTSVVSADALIGQHAVRLGDGLNIMHRVVIYNDASIGEGTLVNTAATVHHDTVIGKYCEISPGARILGRVKVGDFSSIGTNAVILPRVKLGNHVVVGAGAVVLNDVEDNVTVAGNPAKVIS